MLSSLFLSRTQKELQRIHKLYNERAKDLIPEDTADDMGKLHNQKVNIDLEKLALAFDTTKLADPEFGNLTFLSLWKLDKPDKSEGYVFHYYDKKSLSNTNRSIRNISDDIVDCIYEITKILRTIRDVPRPTVGFLSRALIHKDIENHKQLIKNYWNKYYTADFTEEASHIANVIDTDILQGTIVTIDTQLLSSLKVTKDQLTDIAKVLKCNIVVEH